MFFIYHIALQILEILERLHAKVNTKSNRRVIGIRSSLQNLTKYLKETKDNRPIIWFHCASLGEFQQAKPLIEKFASEKLHRILISFYSPSGYENQNKYQYADFVFYLPTDTKKNAKRLVHLIQPQLVIFVKYEFWFNYLNQLNQIKIPFVFISAIFRNKHYLLRFPFKSFALPILEQAACFFVQDDQSVTILNENGINKVIVSGDTRIDSVVLSKKNTKNILHIENFIQNQKTLIIGSSWAEDDEVYKSFINNHPEWKVIIAPHEINKRRIDYIKKLFKDTALTYSVWNKGLSDKQVLIIDNIGMLSSLYKLADVVYVGGGFGEGIHNTLEPGVYEVPLIFGPKYTKFIEAVYFVENNLAFVVHHSEDFENAIKWAIESKLDPGIEDGFRDYFEKNRNGTEKIYHQLSKDKLILQS